MQIPPLPPDASFDGPEMNGQPVLPQDAELLAAKCAIRLSEALRRLCQAEFEIRRAKDITVAAGWSIREALDEALGSLAEPLSTLEAMLVEVERIN